MSAICSRGASFFGPGGNLLPRPLGIAPQYLCRLVPPLRPDLRIREIGVGRFGETAVTE